MKVTCKFYIVIITDDMGFILLSIYNIQPTPTPPKFTGFFFNLAISFRHMYSVSYDMSFFFFFLINTKFLLVEYDILKLYLDDAVFSGLTRRKLNIVMNERHSMLLINEWYAELDIQTNQSWLTFNGHIL
jgi:hypothetical protein